MRLEEKNKMGNYKLLYRSKNFSIFNYTAYFLIFAFLLWLLFSDFEMYAPAFICGIIMIELSHCLDKLFDVYEGFIVVRYPKLTFFKNVLIPLKQVKKIILINDGGYGSNSIMIIEYKSYKREKFRFWTMEHVDHNQLIKCIEQQGVEFDLDRWR